MSACHHPLDVTIEYRPETAMHEFVAYATTAAGGVAADWIAAPGHVEFRGDGAPCRLHFAPRRWLVLGNDGHLQARMAAAGDAGVGTCVDVDGKWVAIALGGPDAGRALSSTIDIDAVLRPGSCAALTLFDCPAVAFRDGSEFRVWVAASYVEAFEAAIRVLSRLEP